MAMAGCSNRCNFFIAEKQDFGPRLDVVIPALKPWQMDIAWIQRPHPHCGKRAATPVNMLTADRARQIKKVFLLPWPPLLPKSHETD